MIRRLLLVLQILRSIWCNLKKTFGLLRNPITCAAFTDGGESSQRFDCNWKGSRTITEQWYPSFSWWSELYLTIHLHLIFALHFLISGLPSRCWIALLWFNFLHSHSHSSKVCGSIWYVCFTISRFDFFISKYVWDSCCDMKFPCLGHASCRMMWFNIRDDNISCQRQNLKSHSTT
jgi:hypothetical protein